MAKRNLPVKKPSSNPQEANYDSPWKQIIEELLESFLEFFFPPVYADINFSRGYEVKSKELYKFRLRATAKKLTK
ncbi:MAG: hypothetical protein JXB88_19810 [Spirochaetales bacterium]|nr:hypothetical protein [Spirochaetales bacterium]